jgi:hypothetical protein
LQALRVTQATKILVFATHAKTSMNNKTVVQLDLDGLQQLLGATLNQKKGTPLDA